MGVGTMWMGDIVPTLFPIPALTLPLKGRELKWAISLWPNHHGPVIDRRHT